MQRGLQDRVSRTPGHITKIYVPALLVIINDGVLQATHNGDAIGLSVLLLLTGATSCDVFPFSINMRDR